MKLTGTQAQILTAAAAHPHGLALPPDRLPAAARQTVGKALLKAGLVTAVEEQDAEAGALWRIDGEPTRRPQHRCQMPDQLDPRLTGILRGRIHLDAHDEGVTSPHRVVRVEF